MIYIDRRSRTHDPMVQAARSGKQKIVEGSMVSGTSKETEIKLTNVARASMEELLEDYRDVLRTKRHPVWDKESREARFVRGLGKKWTDGTYRSQTFYDTYKPFIETRPPRYAQWQTTVVRCSVIAERVAGKLLLRKKGS